MAVRLGWLSWEEPTAGTPALHKKELWAEHRCSCCPLLAISCLKLLGLTLSNATDHNLKLWAKIKPFSFKSLLSGESYHSKKKNNWDHYNEFEAALSYVRLCLKSNETPLGCDTQSLGWLGQQGSEQSGQYEAGWTMIILGGIIISRGCQGRSQSCDPLNSIIPILQRWNRDPDR